MADPKQLAILQRGVEAWNAWRRTDLSLEPDLSGVCLPQENLGTVDFSDTNLSGADLSGANFTNADLGCADLSGANLRGAVLRQATLYNASVEAADLEGADLGYAQLVGTNLRNANLTNCWIYGTSVWDANTEGSTQRNLRISGPFEAKITVDSIEVAQFIHLLLTNTKLRSVIDTITSKVVLILGRFSEERKRVLDALREELAKRGYVPVIFDFDVPANRDVTETVGTLARMSRFIIAALTDPRSIPRELQTIVPDLPSVPVQPIILSSQQEYGMFEHFQRYPWVLPIVRYDAGDDLVVSLLEKIIKAAETKAAELKR